MPALQLRVYQSLDEIESLRPAWDDLLAEFRGATTFSTWEWLAPWWRAFGESRQMLTLAFLDSSSRLVGLAPLQLEKRRIAPGLSLRVLRLWGDGSGDSDNLDCPVRPGYEDQVARALFDHLATNQKAWDVCELNTMPHDSAVGNCLIELMGQRCWTVFQHQRPALAISLPDTWEEYLAAISAKERGKVVYYGKRLEKKYGVRFRRCERLTDVPHSLQALFNLHQQRWQSAGKPGSFRSIARRRFYGELSGLLLQRKRLGFWLLELDGEIVAAQYGFRLGDTFSQLQEGYDPAFAADSVGYVLRAYVIRRLIAAGVRCYDFLAGEDASKLRWAARPSHYLDFHFAQPNSPGSVYLQMVNGAGKSKEWLRAHLPSHAWQLLHQVNRRLHVHEPRLINS
jgi:CelD/BcsL family acetyltransferase involved in cellulose biosynthesis